MIKEFNSADSLDWGEYEKTASSLKSLKSRLPEEATRTLASEVLSRVTDRFMQQSRNLAVEQLPSDAQIDQLANALIDNDINAGRVFISNLFDAGVGVDKLYLAYLAVAARRLGEWWDEDRISFVEVTMGTSRIYGILRMLDNLSGHRPKVANKSAVFATVPGETHTLGVTMAADVFSRNFWEIDLFVGLSHDELISRLEKTDKVIIGITASSSHAIAALAKLIIAIRIHKPEMLILVSGAIVDEAEEIINSIKPDGVAKDIESAIVILDEFAKNQSV